jgi:D-arabinose 1-dehydrogenase-like Zn-dependent alcohol dehydrogenase
MVAAPAGDWYCLHKHMCATDLMCVCCFPEVDFAITDGTRSGERVGSFSRVWKGCCAEMTTKANDYSIAFPDGALPIQKAALLACAILMDFTMFEQQKKQSNGGGGGGM